MWEYEAKMRANLKEQGKTQEEIEAEIKYFNFLTDKADSEYVGAYDNEICIW